MIDPKNTSAPDDEVLIEHFRQHASAEPPASLDAFILAAARREARRPRQACGSAGYRPANGRAGKWHSPRLPAWR